MDNSKEILKKALSEVVVLYVEDEDEVRELANMYLKRHIPNLLVAGSGEEALSISEGKLIDILVTDINMKSIDGAELAIRIKENNPSCYVIFSTAYSNSDRLMQAIDIKVDKYMVKPVDWKELVNTISSYAEQMFMVNHIGDETEPSSSIMSGDVYVSLKEALTKIENSISILSNGGLPEEYLKVLIDLEKAREYIDSVLEDNF